MQSFARFQRRLREKEEDVRARPVTYVAFGDSVTQGCMEYATIEHEEVYHHQFRRLVEARYPRTILNVINAGVSGDTVRQSEERWERDLFMYEPDLVTIGFGVNDAHDGEQGLQPYVDGLQRLTEQLRSRTEADLLILTPNQMIQYDHAGVHESDRPAISKFVQTYEAGYLQRYTEALRNWAERESLPVVDVYAMFEEIEQQGEDIHQRLANGINHPDRLFQKQIAKAIEDVVFS